MIYQLSIIEDLIYIIKIFHQLLKVVDIYWLFLKIKNIKLYHINYTISVFFQKINPHFSHRELYLKITQSRSNDCLVLIPLRMQDILQNLKDYITIVYYLFHFLSLYHSFLISWPIVIHDILIFHCFIIIQKIICM